MVKTDGLFLPLHGLPRGSRSRIVPGKTYEYLRSGLPILGCLPQGDARDLVEGSGRGYCASPCDVDEIASALARMVSDWRASRLAEADLAPIRRFERRALTQDLAATLCAAAS
jgi:glycosyltransferase involved in cell wall biosynthesis